MKYCIPFLILPLVLNAMELDHIAINMADKIDNREHVYISNYVINTYFKNQMNPHLIAPHLKERIEELWNSDDVDDQGSLMDLRKMTQKVPVSEEQRGRVLQHIIIPSAQEAIHKQQRKAARRLTKTQSSWIAAGTGLASTVISAGITIAISSVTHSCSG